MARITLPQSSVLTLFIICFTVLNIVLTVYSNQSNASEQGMESILRVTFFDVGQGDSIHITTPQGNDVLIDAGPQSATVSDLIREEDPFDSSLDLIIATHPDADHIGGFPEVLQQFDVGATLEPLASSTSAVYAAWRILSKEEGVPNLIAYQHQRLTLDASTTLEILAPAKIYEDTNESSIVAKLTYGSTCFLFMGDAPQDHERELVAEYGEALRCQVLKVGHHGSQTSSDPLFISVVDPSYAVLSYGRNNSYGHPHHDVIQTFLEQGVTLESTAEEGTITFTSDGTTIQKQQSHQQGWGALLNLVLNELTQ